MNKLRTKIFLALVFLFLIIIGLGFFGSSFLRRLAEDSGNIIRDNYASAQYSANMLSSINSIYDIHAENKLLKDKRTPGRPDDIKALLNEFEKNLKAEELNVTEAGEVELVGELKKTYADFSSILKKINTISSGRELPASELRSSELLLSEKYEKIQNILRDIYGLNTRAILRKNDQAQQTAGKVSMYMLLISIVSSVISLLFIIYLPRYFVKPLHELTSKIRSISEGNYNQQLNIHSNDELGELSQAFNNMSLKLKEYDEKNIHKLLIEKRRLEAVIDSLNDAIVVLDDNKVIISANNKAYEILGLQQQNLLGRPAAEVAVESKIMRELTKDLLTEEMNSDDQAIQQSGHSGNSYSKNSFTPIQILLNNRESYFSKETITVNISEDGTERLAGYIMLLKNITRFEERDTARTNLLAAVSHELKTPISSINLSLKLLENEKVGSTNDEQKQIMQSVRQQTSRLSKMVNELLDYSQAESGNIKLKIERVSVSDIIDYAAVAMVMIIAEKKIQLETGIEENLPHVQADIEKTVWILVNLINNAVRYTPENGVIHITAKEQNSSVIISVTDQGMGISAEDQEKIFHKFVQVGSQNPRGRGLGLAISKEFAISQGGDIWVESKIGAGSKFSFRLPSAD